MPSTTSRRPRSAVDALTGAGEQRLRVSRIPAQDGGDLPVGGHQIGDRRLRPRQRRESLDERQPDDGQGALAARRLQPMGRERRLLGRDDDVLAVDERAVDIEENELQGSFPF